MNRSIRAILTTFGGFLFLNVATFLMLRSILQYIPLDDQVGFLAQKQDYLHLTIWKTAFYIHVFSSGLTLLAGFTQFSTDLLHSRPKLHKLFGRIYAYDILLINFPAGLIMAIYANGGVPSKAAFLILDSLWFWFTLKAILEIKRGNRKTHREYMIRSYALTLSAISLRVWKIILTNTTDLTPETIYMMNAWLGFVPNWLCAEWIIARKRKPHITSRRLQKEPS